MHLAYRLAFALLALPMMLKTSSCSRDPVLFGEISPQPKTNWKAPNRSLTFAAPSDDDGEGSAKDAFSKVSQRGTPLSADELLDLALQFNPVTKESWQIAKAQAYGVQVAESALFPTVVGAESIEILDAVGTGSLNNASANDNQLTARAISTPIPIPQTVTNPHRRVTNITSQIALNYLILDFGGREAAIKSAKQALIAANWQHNSAIQQVLQGVLNSYYRLLGSKALLQARQASLEDAQTSMKAALAMAKAGIKTYVDALQAQSNAAQAELELEQAKGDVKIVLGQLATALGLPAETQIEVPELPNTIPLGTSVADIDHLIEETRRQRPELAVAQAKFYQAWQAITQARSSGMPTLQLDAEATRTTYINKPLLNNGDGSLILSLQIPISQGGFFINQERQARAAAAAAQAAWQQQEAQVLLDVVTNHVMFEMASASLKPSDDFLRFSEEAYKAMSAQYRLGLVSITDLLDSQKALASARAQQVQTRTQWVTSIVNIAYSTGSLNKDFLKTGSN